MKHTARFPNESSLPENLPKPENDGEADHLPDMIIPKIVMPSTIEGMLDITKINTNYLILYFFPKMVVPGEDIPSGWNDIPGARGCTFQNIAITKHLAELEKYDVVSVGISTQRIEELKEISTVRKFSHILVSDNKLKFWEKIRIPIFRFNNSTMYKRLTLIVKDSRIIKVFYPIFPPDKHIFEILKWFEENSTNQDYQFHT